MIHNVGLPNNIYFTILGWYWIDPNLGMPDDSIYVYCNMSAAGETCIFPDTHSSQMPNIPWRKEQNEGGWYSTLRGGFRVSTVVIVLNTVSKHHHVLI